MWKKKKKIPDEIHEPIDVDMDSYQIIVLVRQEICVVVCGLIDKHDNNFQ